MNPNQLQSLQVTALSLFQTSQGLFWEFLPPLFILAMGSIYISGEISGASFERLFKRIILAIILLLALPQISSLILGIEDKLVTAFGGEESLHTIFSKVAEHAKSIHDESASNWFKLGHLGLTAISTLSFLLLSIVHHFLDVLHLTVWNLLHIFAPLAFLGLLFPRFSNTASGIFFGMFELALWRPTWVIMGRILLAIGFGDSTSDPSGWVDVAIMNFAVAALMATTPIIVHALLNGSLASIGASGLQTMAGGIGAFLSHLPMKGIEMAKSGVGKAVGAAGTAAWTVAGGKWAAYKSRPHVDKAKKYIAQKAPAYWNPGKKRS